jgi:hypothetical protein
MVKLQPVTVWTGNQVNAMVQLLFPNNNAIFQDYNSPTRAHTARSVQSWSEERDDALLQLPSQNNGQT